MKTTKYLGHIFQSSIYKTPEFKQFSRDFRSDINHMLKGSNWSLQHMSTGHFYLSGFFHNSNTGEYVYFSCSDVRFFPDEWYNHLLVRTAKHTQDYMSGMNRYTCFENLREKLDNFALFVVE